MTSKALRSRFNREQVDSALLAFAAAGENASQACRLLGEQGIEVKPATLRTWAEKRHRDRYLELCDQHSAVLDRVLVQRTRAIALRASEVERLAIDKTEEELNAGTAKDASASARNMAVVKGIATDKTLTLTGRPAQIVEHRDVSDLIAKLEKLGIVKRPQAAIDGEAEELPAKDDES
jgi:hypothetical protein